MKNDWEEEPLSISEVHGGGRFVLLNAFAVVIRS
jgi:hypothetical protein